MSPKRIAVIFAVSAIACGSNPANAPSEAGSNRPRDASWIDDGETEIPPLDASTSDDARRGLVIEPAQFTEENMPLRMLVEGGPIELWAAPQGGRVVLVGAKVKYLAGDTVLLRVRVRYPQTNFIIAEEARTVKMVPVSGEADTMQPNLASRSHVAHVPLCPDYDPIDIVDRPVEVTVEVTEIYTDVPKMGEATLNVVPTCIPGAEGELVCRCECTANYVLGKCKPDGGQTD